MAHIIIRRTNQVGHKLFFPSITLTVQEFLLKMDTNYMDNLRLCLIKWTVNSYVLIYQLSSNIVGHYLTIVDNRSGKIQ